MEAYFSSRKFSSLPGHIHIKPRTNTPNKNSIITKPDELTRDSTRLTPQRRPRYACLAQEDDRANKKGTKKFK